MDGTMVLATQISRVYSALTAVRYPEYEISAYGLNIEREVLHFMQ